jgi:hypothetical protein
MERCNILKEIARKKPKGHKKVPLNKLEGD